MWKLPLLWILLTGCTKHSEDGREGTGGGRGLVVVDGSSTVYLISMAVAEEFGRAGHGDVTVAASGTGGGFRKLCRGDIDIADASRPIAADEAAACAANGTDFIELPVAYDGIAVVVNPRNGWVDHLTIGELRTIWEPEASNRIRNWAEIRDGWPEQELDLFGPGTDSGTYDYFTQAVIGKEHSSRGDYTSSEDDNVLVIGVAGDTGALGFFGYAYYTENTDKLKLVAIDAGAGPIAPSRDSVASGRYQPLSRPLFIYVTAKALARPVVRAFVEYYIDHAPELATEVGYIPLPDRAMALVANRLAARRTGSAFGGGSQVGVTVEKLLESESR